MVVLRSGKSLRRLQNRRFRTFSEGAKRRKPFFRKGEAREPHTPAGRVRRENDCRLFIQRNPVVLSGGSYNVTEVRENSLQLQPDLILNTLEALFSRDICCVVIVKFRSFIWKGRAFLFFSVKCRASPFVKRSQLNESNNTEKTASRRTRTRSDSVGLCGCCFKTQLGILRLDNNHRKHFYCAAEKRERHCQCWLKYSEPICPLTLASLTILSRRFYTPSKPFVRIWTVTRFAKNTTVLQSKAYVACERRRISGGHWFHGIFGGDNRQPEIRLRSQAKYGVEM